jgi:error-prone DNA polymerase
MRYAELHCKTNFSFLEGASHPDELVDRAAELGYAALAITDRNSLAGVVRAHGAAKQVGLKLLIGAEITPGDGPAALLWASDRAAYGRLARLITRGRRNAPKGQFSAGFADVAEHADGLLAGVLIEQPDPDDRAQRAQLARYREALGNRCYLLAELSLGPNDASRLDRFQALASRARLPLVAAGDVHYHRRNRLALQDVLTAVRLGTTVAEAGAALFPNAERCLKPPDEMTARFARAPQALARTLEIAERATFSLDELRYEYPEELAPPGETPLAYLTRLAWQGAAKRYPRGVPDKVRGLVEHELALIAELRYEAYFLTVFDLVRFARRRGILCQGRGSAANSAVCYCLGVTSVDPQRMDVLFERFVSRERNEAPDIDVDFEHERREEVLQYIYEKYGRERAGITAEVITYRPRSAVRDVGKALGLSLDRVDALSKSLEGHHPENLAQRCRDVGLDPDSSLGRQLLGLVGELLGFPRHLGQHVGGMVITRGPLCELVPIENAAMADRTVIEWDKDDLDELGILKVDCLSLGMLSAIGKCFQFVEQQTGRRLTLATVPPEDPAVYDMICKADTMGVFQIESRAQMSMLPRLRPREFYDLVIEVALVRPGPIQGNMVHPYLRRRAGEEPVTFPNEAVREVLEKTLGVPLFQEQAMRLAVVAAGFTPGEADALRRAMGAWRRPGIIEQFQQRLMEGMIARGLSDEFAERVFLQIRGFGEYGFPESHAASFALLVYVSAWLKHYHPAAFAAALINSQPMGFYAPAQLVRGAREHGVEVRPIDVNHSDWDCTLEPRGAANQTAGAARVGSRAFEPQPALRLGLRIISGLSASHAEALELARRSGPFISLSDVARRARLSRAVLARLARADAFGSLELDRRKALWQALGQENSTSTVDSQPLFASLPAEDEPPALLPFMPAEQQVLADYNTLGLTLREHPLTFHRHELDALQVSPARQLARLRHGRLVRVAGLVLVRQRPGTARGITFVTLEDETGTSNLIVHQGVWQRFYRAARTATALLAHGRLQRQGEVIHVLVSRLEDLTDRLPGLQNRSRDFQ